MNFARAAKLINQLDAISISSLVVLGNAIVILLSWSGLYNAINKGRLTKLVKLGIGAVGGKSSSARAYFALEEGEG
mgnify:CR=1 FL=1